MKIMDINTKCREMRSVFFRETTIIKPLKYSTLTNFLFDLYIWNIVKSCRFICFFTVPCSIYGFMKTYRDTSL